MPEAKRILDVVFSLLAIVALVPFWLFIVVAIKLTLPGSVLFRQIRIGKDEKPFEILKFRTLCGRGQALSSEFGSFLRRTKLDETPQLFNILAGQMSFVGPRPYIPEESVGLQKERYSVRPGLTGLAQVNGNTFLTWKERTAYDVEYVRNQSLLLDFQILLRTVRVIVKGEKACLKHYK